jgi:DNA polymerase epsilon subunit 1
MCGSVIALMLTVYSRSATTGFDLFDDEIINEQRPNGNMQASDFIVDIREYDVPYHVRVCIDKGR